MEYAFYLTREFSAIFGNVLDSRSRMVLQKDKLVKIRSRHHNKFDFVHVTHLFPGSDYSRYFSTVSSVELQVIKPKRMPPFIIEAFTSMKSNPAFHFKLTHVSRWHFQSPLFLQRVVKSPRQQADPARSSPPSSARLQSRSSF